MLGICIELEKLKIKDHLHFHANFLFLLLRGRITKYLKLESSEKFQFELAHYESERSLIANV